MASQASSVVGGGRRRVTGASRPRAADARERASVECAVILANRSCSSLVRRLSPNRPARARRGRSARRSRRRQLAAARRRRRAADAAARARDRTPPRAAAQAAWRPAPAPRDRSGRRSRWTTTPSAASCSCAPTGSRASDSARSSAEGTRRAAHAPRDRARRPARLRPRARRDARDGNVAAAPGRRLDHRAGAHLPARHARPATFASPTLRHRRDRRARRRRPRSVRRARQLRGHRRPLHDLRRAARGLVPARRELELDTDRAWSAPRATRRCVSSARRSSTRRGSSSRCRTSASRASSCRRSGSSGARGIEFAQPYYFNLAPNYDATVTPRIMTKRGLQLGGQFRYLFGRRRMAERRARSTRRCCRTTAQTDSTRYALVVAAPAADAARLRRLPQPQQGQRRQVLRRPRRPHRDHVADDAAARGGDHLRRTGPSALLARVQTFQTLQDPERADRAAVRPRAADRRHARARRHGAGCGGRAFGEYAQFRSDRWSRAAARCCTRRSPGRPAAPGWFVAARTGMHLRKYDLDASFGDDRNREPRDPDHEPRRGPRVRARVGALRHALHAHARAARLLRLHPVPGAERRCRCSTRRSTTTTSGSSSPRTATSATTASATRTSSRSASTSRLLQPGTGAERLRVALGAALLLRGPARDAERGAALGVELGHPLGVEGRHLGRVGGGGPAAAEPRPRRSRALQRRASATRRRRARRSPRATGSRARSSTRTGRPSRSSSSTSPASGR